MTGATRSVRFVDASTLRRALPVAAAIDALQQAFGDEPLPEAPHRSHLETPEEFSALFSRFVAQLPA